ncbi:hypothetical protein CLV98_104299 [Dyadobacter jejuensis]|uniref:DUF4177 domain-containing protein n=1 Tax=Dyadobacter jejuensis TaxID=1082580 RepID=A0A316AMC5_9BACT|nr:hypothetical protein CLV98_104299 [Dyadobacter jejuensis]
MGRKEFEGKITDSAGKPQLFASLVEAINLLENNGWEMFDHSITLKGRGFLYRYYFRKKES